jgi:hypothetical protein
MSTSSKKRSYFAKSAPAQAAWVLNHVKKQNSEEGKNEHATCHAQGREWSAMGKANTRPENGPSL